MVGIPWKCLGKVWGRVEGHPGRPDLIYLHFHIDWTEGPRDKRDISTGQTGHVHGMAALQKWGCPTELLDVYWFVLFPKHLSKITRLLCHNMYSLVNHRMTLKWFWICFGGQQQTGAERTI